MSPRRKRGEPMKYRGFYCPDDLWKDMQSAAEKLDESDSEYIRKAIEMRNAYTVKVKDIPAEDILNKFMEEPDKFNIKPVKAGTLKAGKPKMVQSFMKDGK
jgi:hypothetical protein